MSPLETFSAAARGLVRVHDLHSVLDFFECAGVGILTFKGPVLDAEFRGTPYARESDDLDLLVRRKDLGRALDLLGREGWAPGLEVHPGNAASHLRYGCELPLAREGRTLLDLHWDLVPAYVSWRPDIDGLWARARTISVAGRPVPTLSRPDAFLHLCVHGGVSDWSREIWVEDVALALDDLGPEEAAFVLAAARRTGALRMVAVAVDLAERRHGAAGPAGLRSRDFADPVALFLADLYAAVLDGNRALPPSTASRVALHLRSRERPADRARHVAGLLQTPSVAEWREAPVAPPVRWARRIARGLRGGSLR